MGFWKFWFCGQRVGGKEKSRVEEALLKVLSFFNLFYLFERNLLNILYKILVLSGFWVLVSKNN
jgi:hypothetical protein